jgi:hypothetical protein
MKRGMTRKSLAEEYYEELDDVAEEKGAEWILLYDFKGLKPNTKFWTNLKRLTAFGGESALIQYSVFHTDKKRVAAAAKKLAEHYGATTEVFKGQRTEL